MSTEHHHITTTLEEVCKTIYILGIDKTISLLRNARVNISSNDQIRFVVALVCQELNVDTQHLLNEHLTDDPTKYAKAFIVYYLRSFFQVKWKEIKSLLHHKDQSWLHELQILIKKLKPKSKADKEWLQHKEILDKKITDYKLQIQSA